MSRRTKITAAVASLAVLAGTALALANISLTLGSTPSFDFGTFGGVQPATVQFHTFTIKAGEVIPWHYHKALSYVVLERGTLTETHKDDASGICVSEEFQAGSAFVEQPGEAQRRQHRQQRRGDHVGYRFSRKRWSPSAQPAVHAGWDLPGNAAQL